MIKQSTGEDWNDTKISLSTAVPSIGGNIPELGTQNLRFKQKKYNMNFKKEFLNLNKNQNDKKSIEEEKMIFKIKLKL